LDEGKIWPKQAIADAAMNTTVAKPLFSTGVIKE
jgi:hypothetical protein